ncbi:hypothetical protein [Pelomonas cellulosilytica]|uniref:DUF2946 domain-containing protein n=1 Tax=Pelomonas cellulosilytica TaxID=2906762 RepID=A0ABS8XXG1_9BURK|nr:hypothetical protein [Pelomonas sp. P8]MCE4556385.1 hypothetical protein [Pelomonas sp. P8]
MNLRRIAHRWLFWLALVLPLAQAMAGVHALSHVTDRSTDGIAHLVHCDLCLTAANLAGGAPAAEPSALPPVVASASVPAPSFSAVVELDAAWRPPARAPPAST